MFPSGLHPPFLTLIFSSSRTSPLESPKNLQQNGRLASPVQVLVLGAVALAATTTVATETGNLRNLLTQTCVDISKTQTCERMQNLAAWDRMEYVCSWKHNSSGGAWTNFFYKRADGSLSSECSCNSGLATYDMWIGLWKITTDGSVTCYTRDGKTAKEVRGQFDSINCPNPQYDHVCRFT